MALKKPSEIFQGNQEDPSQESDGKIRQEETKVNKRIISPQDLFAESVENEILIQEDFNNEVEENFIEEETNDSEINEIKEEVVELHKVVDNIINTEIPKYKEQYQTAELRVESRINDLKKEINDHINLQVEETKNKIQELSKETLGSEVNEAKNFIKSLYQSEIQTAVEKYVSNYSEEIVSLREEIFKEIKKRPTNFTSIETKLEDLTYKYKVLSDNFIAEQKKNANDIVQNNPITLDQLNKHYQILVGRLQEKLASIGGGGEVQLKYLDDVVGIKTNPGAYDGKFLKYDHSLKQFVFETVSGGGGSGDYSSLAGIATYALTAGIATYTSNAGFSTVSGIATYATRSGIATYTTNAGFSTVSGIATYASNSGLSTYSTRSGLSTYASVAGIATYASNAGFSTVSGISTYSTRSGLSTYASVAGIATYATNAGVSTSVIGGIASVSTLNVSGVSTLGTLSVNGSTITPATTLNITGNLFVSDNFTVNSGVPGIGIVIQGSDYGGEATGFYNARVDDVSYGTRSKAMQIGRFQNLASYILYNNGDIETIGRVSPNELNVSGISTLNNVVVGGSTTALLVNGDARITGILTIGTGSITLNGTNDSIRIGTGLTITSAGNANYSGVITATSFVGDGSGLTNLPGGGGTNYWVQTAVGIHTLSNVGIGTTNPQGRLQVGIGTSSIIITGIGSVGIGTLNPRTKLEIDGVLGFRNTNVRIGNRLTGGSSGSENILIGNQAGSSLTFGSTNILMGFLSGAGTTNKTGNIYIGSQSGFENDGNYNTHLGDNSGYSTLGDYNIYFGSWTGASSGSRRIVIGSGNGSGYFDAPNTTQNNQFAVGIRTDANPSQYWLVGNESFNIGIGTTNPTSKLYVQGDARIVGTITATSFVGDGSGLTGIVASGTGIAIRSSGSPVGTAGTIDFGSNLSVSFGSGIATITATGAATTNYWVQTAAGINTLSNVGIGTTNPTNTLTVGGGTSTRTLYVIGISTFRNGPVLIGSATSTGTALQPLQVTGGAYVSGNLGIGTTNPQFKLHVQGDLLLDNISVGNSGLYVNYNLSDPNNLVFGRRALYQTNASSGNKFNIAIGNDSLGALGLQDSGQYNIALGQSALGSLGYYGLSMLIGGGINEQPTGGDGNVALGYGSLYNLGYESIDPPAGYTYDNNTSVGKLSLFNLLRGSNNIAVGNSSGRGLQYGSNNTIIGVSSVSSTLNNQLLLGAGGVEYIRVNTTGVGIGTTNPTSKLDVVGDGKFTGVVTATTFVGNFSGSIANATNLTGGIATASQLNVTGVATVSGGRIQADAASNLRFGNLPAGSGSSGRNIAIGDQVLYSLNGGSGRNIGIGELSYYDTTSGQYNIGLGIQAGQKITTGSYNLILGGYDGQTGLDIRTSSNNIVIADGQGNIRQYINSSGNVGIKTTVITAALTVAGVVSATSFYGTLNAGQLTGALPAIDGSALFGVTASGTGIVIKDDGITVGTAGTVDFGSGLSVSFGAGIATVSGASSVSAATTAYNLAGTPNISVGIVTAGIITSISGSRTVTTNSGTWNASLDIANNTADQYRGSILRLKNGSGDYGTGLLNANFDASGLFQYFSIEQIDSGDNYVKTLASYNYQYESWEFRAGASNAVQFSANQNGVGIGTTNVTSKLTVSGNANISGVITASSFVGSGANLTSLPAGQLSGSLPAIDGSALLNVNATGSGIVVLSNGVNVGSARTVNFGTGLGVTYTSSGIATITASGGSLQSRTIVSGTTTSIINNGIGNTNITGFKSYALMKVGLSTAGWLRLYTDNASRIADASRSIGIDPSPGSGVIAEVITTGISTTQIITPFVMGGNLDEPSSTTIYAAITNLSGSTQAITANLTILQLEA